MDERGRGVVTASAGNHGMGVAYGARLFSIPATIVVPVHANETKVDAIAHMQAEVIRHGETYQEAYDQARKIEQDRQAIFVHAFDDADVISGQATIGLELMQQHPEVTTILVPVGGGGLIGGIAAAVKQVNPRISVVGVQAEGAPSMQRALASGRVSDVHHVNTIADGLATTHVGELTFALAKRYVDEMVLVSDQDMLKAIHYLLEHEHLLAEPAGAAACAALMFRKTFPPTAEVVVLLTGANISVPVLREAVAIKE
jgi:threonine dehydratase